MMCRACGKPMPPEMITCPHCRALQSEQHTGAQPHPAQTIQAIPVTKPIPAASPVQPEHYSSASSTGTLKLPVSRARRLINFIIDQVALQVVAFGVGLVLGLSGNESLFIAFGLGLVVYATYYVVFETLTGRTLGKMVTGSKVVMKDGSAPTARAVFLRTVIRFVPFESLTFLTARTPHGWHDRWSDTMVVPVSYTADDVRAIDVTKIQKTRGLLILAIVFLFLLPVVAMMAAITLSSLNTARQKGRDALRVSDVKFVSLGLELYFSDVGDLPRSLGELVPNYMENLPADPTTGELYPYVRCGESSYHIGANLEAPGAVLDSDSDALPMCEGDSINGEDSGPCVGPATEGVPQFCYDLYVPPLEQPSAEISLSEE